MKNILIRVIDHSCGPLHGCLDTHTLQDVWDGRADEHAGGTEIAREPGPVHGHGDEEAAPRGKHVTKPSDDLQPKKAGQPRGHLKFSSQQKRNHMDLTSSARDFGKSSITTYALVGRVTHGQRKTPQDSEPPAHSDGVAGLAGEAKTAQLRTFVTGPAHPPK